MMLDKNDKDGIIEFLKSRISMIQEQIQIASETMDPLNEHSHMGCVALEDGQESDWGCVKIADVDRTMESLNNLDDFCWKTLAEVEF